MTHDQPARLACRAPRALRLPCLHHPTTATRPEGTPMTRPTIAAPIHRPDRLNPETLPVVLLDGSAHVPVFAVVAWLDAHANRWDTYADDVDTAPTDGRPYDRAEEDTRAATIVGAHAIADELTHRATDLSRLHATATLDSTVPHLTGTPKAVESCRAVLYACLAGLLAWLILAGWLLR